MRNKLNIVSTRSVWRRVPSPLKASRFLLEEGDVVPVLRKNKKANYTVINNHVFRNTGLSLKAKGLLCQMLSLPDNWEYSLEGLVTLASDGISSVRSALKELENQMYFKRHRLYKNGKVSGVEYIISETPMCENLLLENLKEENLILGNQAQLNTNSNQINKKSNNKKINKMPPSIDDVEEYCKQRNNGIDAEAFVDYYAQQGWKLANGNPMKDWQAAVRTWEKRNRKEEKPKPKRYPEFEQEEKVDAVEMPEEIRRQISEIF